MAINEGPTIKGGNNPPCPENATRPPAPQGSGGNEIRELRPIEELKTTDHYVGDQVLFAWRETNSFKQTRWQYAVAWLDGDEDWSEWKATFTSDEVEDIEAIAEMFVLLSEFRPPVSITMESNQ